MHIIIGTIKNSKSIKYSILIFLLIFTTTTFAQDFVKSYPVFKSGERITYNAAYNWGFIWINAGFVQFKVEEKIWNGKPAYHYDSFGFSIPSYDWLFKVRDYFQSYASTSDLSPYHFIRDTYEGGYEVNNQYTFNYQDSLIYSKTENTNQPYKEDTLQIQQQIHDVISGVYYVRNLDFEQYQINDTIPVKMIVDNEIFDLFIRYLGKEVLKTRDNRKFNTIKFSALLIEGTIFKGGEDLTVWVTDDLNRIPVLVEAKILIGSVKATLDKTENLKFPMSAEIKD